MKKFSLIVLLALGFLFLTQTGFSQHPIFVSAGAQETWITGVSSLSGSTHGQIGVGMGIADLSDQISFRGELVFSMQGAHYSDGHINSLYFNLPLVLRYHVESGLFGELGLQPGYLYGAKDHYSGGSNGITNQMESFDFGIPIGVGKEFKNNFGVGLRYILGITNVFKGGSGDEDDSGNKGRNAVLALRVTYTFNKNKK